MFGISARIFMSCALLLLMTFFLQSGSVAAEGDLGKVRIAVTRFMGDAHNFIAMEKGLFKKHGLDAELVINNTGIQSVQQLLRGEVDFAMITPTPILFASFDPSFFLRRPEPDPPLAIVANVMQSTSLNSVVVAADGEIKTPKDLEGKRIALHVGTGSEYYWYAFTVYHGINYEKVKIIDAKIQEMAGLLESGAVDGFTVWHPVMGSIRRQIKFQTVALPEQKIYSNARLVTVRPDFVTKHIDFTERYLRALYEAEAILQHDYNEVARIMSKKLNISEDEAKYLQTRITFNIALDESLLFSLSEQAKWVNSNKYRSKKILPDYRMILFEKPLTSVKPSGVDFIK